MSNLLSQQARDKTHETPLLFVHGQWFGPWCWEENYFRYFNDKGFDTYAVNLRGYSEKNRIRILTATMQDYVKTLADAVAQFSSPPLLIGHGMGSNIILKYMSGNSDTLVGVCLLAPLPFNKIDLWNGDFHKQHKTLSSLIFRLGLGRLLNKYELGRKAMFSDGLTKVERRHHPYYLSQLQNESPRVIRDIFNQEININTHSTPMNVIGGLKDSLITSDVVRNVANTIGVEPIFVDVAHAMMLDVTWYKTSRTINNWIDTFGVA